MTRAIVTAALLSALPTLGYAEKWEKVVTIYGWLPGLDTSIGTAFGDFESSSSGSDAISNLQMVFMGTFEAHYGRWGIVKDIIYVDLSDTQSTPFGRLFSDGTVDVSATGISGYLTYKFAENSTARYEVAGGFRYFDLVFRVRHLLPISPDLVERVECAALSGEDVLGGFAPDEGL
ncbi:MAG: hypothetical protein V2I51_22095, partial [Anderseniella sp.]|nr:hypothetical protein [Anderseniella sp.]